MDELHLDRLTLLFKALADPARLRILGAIADAPLSGRELSQRLGLTPPTISHHMARLVAAGLVTATPDAQRRLYALDASPLRDLARGVTPPPDSIEQISTPRTTTSTDDADRAKILRDFINDGRLRQIPAQRKKRVVVLRHLLERFVPDRDYPEREVNDLLRPAHDDVATLRRELVDYGFMTRDKGIYRIANDLPTRGPTVAQEVGGDETAWLRALLTGSRTRPVTHPSPEST